MNVILRIEIFNLNRQNYASLNFRLSPHQLICTESPNIQAKSLPLPIRFLRETLVHGEFRSIIDCETPVTLLLSIMVLKEEKMFQHVLFPNKVYFKKKKFLRPLY